MTPTARLTLSVVLLSSWLVLLLSGVALGGAIHLLLAASIVAFPWRVPGEGPGQRDEETPSGSEAVGRGEDR